MEAVKSASLLQSVSLCGRALFSGEQCRIEVLPGPVGGGISFLRDGVTIPASPAALTQSANCTQLSSDNREVRVLEHLFCALWAAGIDQAVIKVDSADGELPNFDGSALPFYEALLTGGRREFGPRPVLQLRQRLELGDDTAYFVLEPADAWSINYSFAHPDLGEQEFNWRVDRHSAPAEVLGARTFATLSEITAMQAAGLLRNDDERAGLLIRDGVPAQPLRFANEFARHKVLDLLGDLYLLPFDWPCKVTAYRTGHAMNHLLAKELIIALHSGAAVQTRAD